MEDPVARGVSIQNFKLLRLLGQGGVGAVYLGEDPQSGRRVAIKILKAAESASAEVISRFQREGNLLRKLRHPSIVEVYDFGVKEGVGCFLVMEYLEGESLKTYLQRNGPLSPYEAARIGLDILGALEVVHQARAVHRDLKPSNIYLIKDEDGHRAKLLDFGVAKLLDGGNAKDALQTRRGVILGSPGYMAPEQAAGSRTIDGRVDLYSLGVILFECLAGRRPFLGSSYLDLFVIQKTKPAPPLSRFVPRIPEALEAFVRDCLEKDLSRRPQSARLLKERLEEMLPSLPRTALPVREVLAEAEGEQEEPFLEAVDEIKEETQALPAASIPKRPPSTKSSSLRPVVVACMICASLLAVCLWYLVWAST